MPKRRERERRRRRRRRGQENERGARMFQNATLKVGKYNERQGEGRRISQQERGREKESERE
jgi:hypothetical protein